MGKQAGDVRMSLQTLRVLEAFLEDPTAELAGADVQKRGKLASGTLYSRRRVGLSAAGKRSIRPTSDARAAACTA
jgi:hypothetical protein